MIRPTQRKSPRESIHLGAQFEPLETRAMMTAQPPGDFFLDYIIEDQQYIEDQRHDDPSPMLTDAHALTGLDDARASYGFTGAGQTVAVIDSGIAYDHYALGGGFGSSYRVVGGWDFTGENDANPYDDAPGGAHGTHVAGIIGSDDTTNQGVAPGVDLVALRVFDDTGAGYFSWVENALQWVHDNRNSFASPITTVNLSIGTPGWNSDSLPSWAMLEDEFAQLEADGIFIAVAAGNSFTSYNTTGLSYPAVSSYVVPVASVDDNGALSYFSQRDVGVIAAPGRGVTSTIPDYVGDGNGLNDDFGAMSGTSMATPYVAGASVLLREALQFVGTTGITQDMIYQIMVDTADSVYDVATAVSYNRLNVQAALDSIIPADEYGDDVAGAFGLGTLSDSQSTAGMLTTLSDADYFTFTAGQTGTVTFSSSLTTATGNVGVQLQHVGGATSSSGSLSFAVVTGQTYSVAISSPGELGSYTLAAALNTSSPSRPGSVTSSGMSSSQITITWSDSAGEDGYRVHMYGGGNLATLAAGTTTYTATGLNSNQAYWFSIEAYNGGGSSYSAWTSGATLLASPVAPSGVNIATASSSQLDLSWNDSGSEDGYLVYRWNGSSSQMVAALSANTTSYSATGLDAAQTHWFTIGAYNDAGSNFSAWTSGTTSANADLPTAPANVNLSAVSSSRIQITWSDAAREDGYRIYHWGSGGTQLIGTAVAGSTSFVATSLQAGANHWFTVEAHNSAGSAYTSWQTGSTPSVVPTSAGSLSLTPASSSQIDLSWNDADWEDGYWVYRWNGSSSQMVASLAAGVTQYSATGLDAEQTHWFTVGAYNSVGATFTVWTGAATPAVGMGMSLAAGLETEAATAWTSEVSTSFNVDSDAIPSAALENESALRRTEAIDTAMTRAEPWNGNFELGQLSRSIVRRQLNSAHHLSETVFGAEAFQRPDAELLGVTSPLGPHSLDLQWVDRV